MKTEFLLILFITRIYCFASKQSLLSNFCPEYSDQSSPELVQILLFYRHGNYAPQFFFYESEYDDYDLEYPPYSLPTYLGNSQSWSLGQFLRSKFSDFFKDISISKDTKYIVGDYERSISNAEHLSCGIAGNIPDWDYQAISKIPTLALSKYGYCQECGSDTYIDIDALADENGYYNATTDDTPDISIQNDYFFDIDSDCKYITQLSADFNENIYKLIYMTYGILITDDQINDLASTFASESGGTEDDMAASIRIISVMYNNHYKHGLDNLILDDKLLEDFLEYDVMYWYYEKYFDYIFEEDKLMAQIFDSFILESMLEELYTYNTDPKKMVTYLMHDNNLYALMQLLMNQNISYPDFASDIRIHVYKEEDSESYYVNAFYNGDEFTIDSCERNCSLDKFYEIIESYIIDSIKFCNNNQSQLIYALILIQFKHNQ